MGWLRCAGGWVSPPAGTARGEVEGVRVVWAVGVLQRHPLEKPFGDRADDEHSQTPDRTHVDDVTLATDPLDHRNGHLLRFRRQAGRQSHPVGHPRTDESRLDRHDVDTGPGQPVSQSGQEGRESGLGRTVYVVDRTPSISGDRADADEDTGATARKLLCQHSHQKGRTDEVGLHDLLRGSRIALARDLIAQETDDADRHVGQRIERIEEGGSTTVLEHVANAGGDGAPATELQIPNFPVQPSRVPARDLQRVAATSQTIRNCPTNVGSGPDDQCGFDPVLLFSCKRATSEYNINSDSV